jgi:type IV pilus assembly protein PilB
MSTEDDVRQALAGQAGMASSIWSRLDDSRGGDRRFPAENAKAYKVVPIEYDPSNRRLTIAMKSPDNFQAVDDLRLLMGFKVEAVVADAGSQVDA